MVTNLWSPVTPEFVVMTTYATAYDDKVFDDSQVFNHTYKTRYHQLCISHLMHVKTYHVGYMLQIVID